MLRATAIVASFVPIQAWAIDSEIHVYDDSIAVPGTLNLTLHNNYVASGARTANDTGLVPNHSLTGGAEWTYGAAPWLECGAYFPILSYTQGGHLTLDGSELRVLVLPTAAPERHYFYGANLALGFNNRGWNEHRVSAQIKPIVGAHWGAVTLTLNPALESDLDGVSNLELAPSERLSVEAPREWTVALEHYAQLGPIRHLRAASTTEEELFAVVAHRIGAITIESGAGFGLTAASDHLTVKVILSFDLR